MDFWLAREGKCSMVLSILESLKHEENSSGGSFLLVVSYSQKTIKLYIGELAHPFRGWETSLPLVVLVRLEKVKPILNGQSFRYFYEHE